MDGRIYTRVSGNTGRRERRLILVSFTTKGLFGWGYLPISINPDFSHSMFSHMENTYKSGLFCLFSPSFVLQWVVKVMYNLLLNPTCTLLCFYPLFSLISFFSTQMTKEGESGGTITVWI